MKLWRDFPEKSVLTVIFGVVSADVWLLGQNRYGITTHPGSSWEFSGTLDQAKSEAQVHLVATLGKAMKRLTS